MDKDKEERKHVKQSSNDGAGFESYSEELLKLRDTLSKLRGKTEKKKKQKLKKKIEKLESLLSTSSLDSAQTCSNPVSHLNGVPGVTDKEEEETRTDSYNYVPTSIPGCYVARFDADWVIGTDRFDPDEFGLDGNDAGSYHELVPEISIDPDTKLLTVINAHRKKYITYTISLTEQCLPLTNEASEEVQTDQTDNATNAISRFKFKRGRTSKNENNEKEKEKDCITLLLILKPMHIMDVCYVNDFPCVETGKGLFSDIKEWVPHSCCLENENEEEFGSVVSQHNKTQSIVDGSGGGNLSIYDFPLETSKGPFLCSQGFGGHFTHFFYANHHAIDFECPIGTPVLAVADAVVTQVNDQNNVSGIHGSNLYKWNSVTLHLCDGNYAEYVHIKHGSACVKTGQKVKCGDQICLSGSVGFSPRPHLHFQITKDDADHAETIPFMISSKDGKKPYIPVAGFTYP